MFGKSFEEKVKDALNDLGSLHIKNLDAKIDGKVVTLSGEASDMAAKTRAMTMFNEKVETENTINLIRIAAPTHVAAPVIAASQTMGPPAPAGSVPHAHAGAGCCGSSAMPGPVVTRTDGSAAAEVRMHEVAKGDTLSAISKQYYGASNQYMKIFDANKDLLKDPDHIYPGQKLRIP